MTEMTERALQTFHESFERCMRHPDFFDHFYDRFVRSSLEVADKFRNTEFVRQKRVLKLSLYSIQEAAVRRRPHYEGLGPIASRHSRDEIDIRPELYELWLEALVETVAECDRDYTDEVGEVWRAALRPAIDYMTARY